jgi:hypothetical protein
MNKIIVHAQNAGGPEITGSKAVTIVALGGRVVLTAASREVSVNGSGYLETARPITVSYPSYGPSSPADAELHGQMIKAAAGIAQRAAEYDGPDFSSPPPWVNGGKASELVSYRAASRYGAGDVTWTGAWKYAAERANQDI